jgi:hypothetical protein
LFWVVRELSIADDELVEVVSKEVSTRVASMAVKDTKESAFRPVFALLTRRLHDVQDD